MNSRPEVASENSEFEFLLKCVTEGTLPNCDPSGRHIRWDALAYLAAWHGVEPPLFAALQKQSALVPGGFLEALGSHCHNITMHNLKLSAELLKLSGSLRAAGIQHLVYKGPLLALQLYGAISARGSSDLDIIVHQSDVARASCCLEHLGFFDGNGFSVEQRSAAFHYGFEYSFSHQNGAVVDLHWRTVPEFAARQLDMEGFWKRSVSVRFYGSDLPSFAPEDSLFTLCMHAAQHDWLNLCLFRDISQLIKAHHPGMDWRAVLAHLTDSHVERGVLVSLAIVNRHWGTPLPEEVLQRIVENRHIGSMVGLLRNELWPSAENPGVEQADIRWLLRRTEGERIGDRFRYIAGIIARPTQADFAAAALPKQFQALYPVVRFLRLLGPRVRGALNRPGDK